MILYRTMNNPQLVFHPYGGGKLPLALALIMWPHATVAEKEVWG